MGNQVYLKQVIVTLLAALVCIPSIALGFYLTYQLVTTLGN